MDGNCEAKKGKKKDEQPITQLRNKIIRRKWILPTIRSSIKKDRISYNLRAKKTQASYYQTYKRKVEEELEEYRKELIEKKEKLELYRGTECKKTLEKPTEEEMAEIKMEEEQMEMDIENQSSEEEIEKDALMPSNPLQMLVTLPTDGTEN